MCEGDKKICGEEEEKESEVLLVKTTERVES
jgi:hypothetical protein